MKRILLTAFLWLTPIAALASQTFAPLATTTPPGLTGLAMALGINANENALLTAFSGTSAPASPVAGQFWFDTTHTLMKYYDGSAFNTVGSSGGGSVVIGTSLSGANPQLPADAASGLYSSGAHHVETIVNGAVVVDIGTSGMTTTGTETATAFVGPITGTVTGNASTATALQTPRTIGGVSFNGTANITVATATGGFTITGGDLAIGTNNLTMTGSIGATGARVTKLWATDITATNAIAGSVTGNSGTATALASTPTQCSGGAFATGITTSGAANCSTPAGSGNVNGPGTATISGYLPVWVGTSGTTIGTGLPVGTSGNNTVVETNGGGQIPAAMVPTLNQSTTGNAATATALATARAINGVNFDGTAAITVPAAGSTLTGTSLASGIVTSSLTSVGTLGVATITGLVSAGTIAIGTTSVHTGVALDLGSNTNSLLLPSGTTGQRPTGINGMLRYNSTSVPTVEAYVNNAWTALGAGSGSGTVTASPQYEMATFPTSGTTATVAGISQVTTNSSGQLLISSNLGIATTSPQAIFDIGGLIPVSGIASGLGSASGLVSASSNAIAGIQMTNSGNGTSSEFRFIISGSGTTPTSTDPYIAFSMPGPSNTATLFGQTRSNIATIFTNNGSPGRMLALGTVNATDMLLGTGNAERVRIANATGWVGIGSTIPRGDLDLSFFTDAVLLPSGTTGQRPGTGVNGMIRYNSTTPTIEAYIGNVWTPIPGTSGGSGTVTSVATTSPITGGTITTSGTIGCSTCGVTGSPLSQFAATTSAQLAGVISDETGTGVLVFATNAVLTTPNLGVAIGTSLALGGATLGANALAIAGSMIGGTYNGVTIPSTTDTVALLGTNQSYTKGQAVTPTASGAQSAAGTLTPDWSLSNSTTFTFGAGNLTLANPTNVKAGQTYTIQATQDGTGSRTLTWGTEYKFAGGIKPTLSTAASAKDIISCWADTTTTLNCALVGLAFQ